MRSGLPYRTGLRWYELVSPRDVILKQIVRHFGSLSKVDAIAVLLSSTSEEDDDDEPSELAQRELVQLSDGSLWGAYCDDGYPEMEIPLLPVSEGLGLADEIKKLDQEYPKGRVSLPWDYTRSRGIGLFVATFSTRKWIAGQIRRNYDPNEDALDRITDALFSLVSEKRVFRVTGCRPSEDDPDFYIIEAENLVEIRFKKGARFKDDREGGIWIFAGVIAERRLLFFSPLQKNQRLPVGMILTEVAEATAR